MTSRLQVRRLFLAIVIVAFAAMRAPCQVTTTPTADETREIAAIATVPGAPEKQTLTNSVEIGSSYFNLTDGFGPWNGGYARGMITSGNDTFNGEIAEQHEFGDSGTYFAVGDSHNFGANSFASLRLAPALELSFCRDSEAMHLLAGSGCPGNNLLLQ